MTIRLNELRGGKPPHDVFDYDARDLPIYPDGFPEVVTLCGSTRFRTAFELEQARLTDEGKVVLSVGRFGHQDGLDMAGDHKKMLDELHKRKIDMSDGIFVVNDVCPVHAACGKPVRYLCDGGPGGRQVYRCGECDLLLVGRDDIKDVPYVGESTKGEIEYALAADKRVTYLNPPA